MSGQIIYTHRITYSDGTDYYTHQEARAFLADELSDEGHTLAEIDAMLGRCDKIHVGVDDERVTLDRLPEPVLKCEECGEYVTEYDMPDHMQDHADDEALARDPHKFYGVNPWDF